MFGFGKNSFLGIDIGTSSIKLVEIKIKGNKPVLANYAWVYLENLTGEKRALFSDNWPAYIERMLREAKFGTKDAFIAVPAAGALITLVEFPSISSEDLDQAIRYEAHKYIPTSLDEVVISWDVVSQIEQVKKTSGLFGGKSEEKAEISDAPTQVVLVAAPKSKVENYEKLVKDCGLGLKGMEIESFSLVRSLVGNDQGNFIIVDIGSRICNIILVERGIIKVNRNIDAGGRDITRVIAHSLSIDEERAESLKSSNKDFLTGETTLEIPALEIIVLEIKRVLNEYYKSEAGTQINNLILSGGTANMTSIDKYFQKALGIKAIIGNPLGRIEYDKKLESRLAGVKSQLAVSVGLALRGVEDHLSK